MMLFDESPKYRKFVALFDAQIGAQVTKVFDN